MQVEVKDMGWIAGLGRSLKEGGHGNPLKYSCLENPMDRGVWQSAIHRLAQSQTWLRCLSTHTWYGMCTAGLSGCLFLVRKRIWPLSTHNSVAWLFSFCQSLAFYHLLISWILWRGGSGNILSWQSLRVLKHFSQNAKFPHSMYNIIKIYNLD